MAPIIDFHVEARGPTGWHRVEEPTVDADGRLLCDTCGSALGKDNSGSLHLRPSSWCDPEPNPPLLRRREWYRPTNRSLFAILGDDTLRWSAPFQDDDAEPDGLVSIVAPRGLPDDVGPEVRARAEFWAEEARFHTYYTAAELLAFDWDRTSRHAAWFDDVESKHHPNGGRVDSLGRLIREIGYLPDQLAEPVGPELSQPGPSFRRLSWTEPYWQRVDNEFFGVMTRMYRFAAGDPQGVRCVLWFRD